jgi:hypothetical protein
MTAEELVAESCAHQGVPIHVEDPEVLAQVAHLVRTHKESTGGPTSALSGPRKVDRNASVTEPRRV